MGKSLRGFSCNNIPVIIYLLTVILIGTIRVIQLSPLSCIISHRYCCLAEKIAAGSTRLNQRLVSLPSFIQSGKLYRTDQMSTRFDAVEKQNPSSGIMSEYI